MTMRLDRLRDADLNLLICFVILAEEKNVTRAAMAPSVSAIRSQSISPTLENAL